ncbi:MAG TPA: c-type cytochrome [Nannocystaceae bacterium]|nr:c-type cytochrome [Nannocystaceae bacterium]
MRLSIAIVVIALAACAPQKAPSQTPSAGATTPTAAPTFADQVARGQEVYGAHCGSCHGDAGEGTSGAPRVVGLAEGALPQAPRAGSQRTTEFVTVADVAGFAVATMPPNAPGSLPEADYWAVLAFDLHANGIDLDAPLTAEAAQSLKIPR